MNTITPDPRKTETTASRTDDSQTQPLRQREGGDDALSEPNSSDARLDEKVVVNEQSQQKVVNSPSQSEAHPTESSERLDEIQ